ncbi:hypothetical protein HY632_02320 [Candidatus Uhrbacteria bacterium]|nr:hypothetical protein [Candidatus Uhrbacteria bacterium]
METLVALRNAGRITMQPAPDGKGAQQIQRASSPEMLIPVIVPEERASPWSWPTSVLRRYWHYLKDFLQRQPERTWTRSANELHTAMRLEYGSVSPLDGEDRTLREGLNEIAKAGGVEIEHSSPRGNYRPIVRITLRDGDIKLPEDASEQQPNRRAQLLAYIATLPPDTTVRPQEFYEKRAAALGCTPTSVGRTCRALANAGAIIFAPVDPKRPRGGYRIGIPKPKETPPGTETTDAVDRKRPVDRALLDLVVKMLSDLGGSADSIRALMCALHKKFPKRKGMRSHAAITGILDILEREGRVTVERHSSPTPSRIRLVSLESTPALSAPAASPASPHFPAREDLQREHEAISREINDWEQRLPALRQRQEQLSAILAKFDELGALLGALPRTP